MVLDMDTSLRLSHRLEQTLKMAPQIIQSIEILQLPMLDLRERVEQELTENPVLEIQEGGEAEKPEVADETMEEQPLSDVIQTALDEEDRWRAQLKGSRSRAVLSEESDQKREAMENALAANVTLEDHLLAQLRLAEVDDKVRRVAENVISNMDENGYLLSPLEDILASVNDPSLTMAHAEDALRLVQRMEPPGIGARSLAECLLLQFDERTSDYEFKRLLIEHHLEDIGKNRLPKVAKETGRPLEDVKDAIAFIAHLNPSPGAAFSSRPVPYVIPDVIVEKVDGRFEIRLEESEIPPLYVSRLYRDLVQNRSTDPATRAFIRKKIQAARWLIESIEQRRSTVYRVASSIVNAQKDFLEKGALALVPLKMQDIADEVGIHVSTVGRAIKDKYMQCPVGIFPMKYFFTGGTRSDDGQDQSWKSIKLRLSRMIDEEDKSDPLSDKEIADRFASAGIHVKRRTIAKYREAMNIPSSRERKAY
ncbi:MAG: RNA polymerase factor sigma-54 [Planctomycetota bacterium]